MHKRKTLYDYNTPAAPVPQRAAGLTVGSTPIEIALGIDGQGRTTAKKLYAFLELAQSQYARWCRNNITDNIFAEAGTDFIVFDMDVENPKSGRPTQDYLLTATFAKKLAMASNSARGEQAREYFIRVEGQLKRLVTSGQQAYMIPQEPQRVTLNEIELLDQIQAQTRYSIGRDMLIRVGKKCDGLVWLGKFVRYNRRKFDSFFEEGGTV